MFLGVGMFSANAEAIVSVITATIEVREDAAIKMALLIVLGIGYSSFDLRRFC
jgi:hypothetical protein